MQALDLHVEQRMRVQLLPGLFIQVRRKGDLVPVLDVPHALQHRRVICKLGKVRKLFRMVPIAGADAFVQQCRQPRVGVAQPAPVRDAVGHVVEALRVHPVEVLEDALPQDLRVQFGHAVDRMRADDGQIRHVYLPVADDAHLADALPVAGVDLPCLAAEPLVDLLDDGVNAGQLEPEQILVPRLQRLRHDGVVGVGADAPDNAPGVLPREEVFVHQNAHQLRDDQCGMRVIEMDGNLVRQVGKRAVDRHVVADDALAGSGAEEILLCQAEQLALGVVVGGVQHLGDRLGVGILLHRLRVLPLREQTHVEIMDIPRAPQPQTADRLGIGAGDHHVVGDCLDLLGVLIGNIAVPVAPLLPDVPAETDAEGAVGARHQPDLAAGQPDVRQFDLDAVHDHLPEQTVIVAQREAGGGIIQRGQRIHEAGGKPPQTAVAQSGIRLAVIQLLQREAHAFQRLAVGCIQPEIAQVVLERAPQQELHAHIVYALGAGLIDLLLEGAALFGQDVPDSHGGGFVHLVIGRLGGGTAEVTRQLDLQVVAYLVGSEFRVLHTESPPCDGKCCALRGTVTTYYTPAAADYPADYVDSC